MIHYIVCMKSEVIVGSVHCLVVSMSSQSLVSLDNNHQHELTANSMQRVPRKVDNYAFFFFLNAISMAYCTTNSTTLISLFEH